MANEEINRNLRKKLDEDYNKYTEKLLSMSPHQLIDQAIEIAAMKRVYSLLTDGRVQYAPELLKHLLRFQNLLEVVRDQWTTNHGFDPYDDMAVHLSHIVAKSIAEKKSALKSVDSTLQLAREIDDFMYSYDQHGYGDNIGDRYKEDTICKLTDLLDGAGDETTARVLHNITEMLHFAIEIDNQDNVRAKNLLERLNPYLAKLELAESQQAAEQSDGGMQLC